MVAGLTCTLPGFGNGLVTLGNTGKLGLGPIEGGVIWPMPGGLTICGSCTALGENPSNEGKTGWGIPDWICGRPICGRPFGIPEGKAGKFWRIVGSVLGGVGSPTLG